MIHTTFMSLARSATGPQREREPSDVHRNLAQVVEETAEKVQAAVDVADDGDRSVVASHANRRRGLWATPVRGRHGQAPFPSQRGSAATKACGVRRQVSDAVLAQARWAALSLRDRFEMP